MKGRAWARLGFITGITASISGNIAHGFIAPPHVKDWQPSPGGVVTGAFWPAALLITVEVLARVQWPSGWLWWLCRWGGMTTVAAIAATISYLHMHGLLVAYGEDPVSALLGPLSVDGLMVVCSAALLATGAPTVSHEVTEVVEVAGEEPAKIKSLPTHERYELARARIQQMANDLGRKPVARELAETDPDQRSRRWWSSRLSEV